MDDLAIFARNLEAVRIAKGYTQENLSLDAGVARSYISNMKRGGSAATIQMVARLADKLGVRSHHLLLEGLEVVSLSPEQAEKGVPAHTATTVYIVKDQTSKRKLRA